MSLTLVIGNSNNLKAVRMDCLRMVQYCAPLLTFILEHLGLQYPSQMALLQGVRSFSMMEFGQFRSVCFTFIFEVQKLIYGIILPAN